MGKYKLTPILNQKRHGNGGSYYLLHSSNTWEKENNLLSLNSAVVKDNPGSNKKKIRKTEVREKPVHSRFDIDGRKSIVSTDSFKQEQIVDHDNGRDHANMFCNIMACLLNDDTEDTTKRRVGCDKSITLPEIDNMNFSCKVICKKDSTSNILKRQQLTYTGDKPYSCKICDIGFKRCHDLKRHHLIHSGEKPFACDICERRFTQLSTLKGHQLTHTGDKYFTCNICNKIFARSSTMKGTPVNSHWR